MGACLVSLLSTLEIQFFSQSTNDWLDFLEPWHWADLWSWSRCELDKEKTDAVMGRGENGVVGVPMQEDWDEHFWHKSAVSNNWQGWKDQANFLHTQETAPRISRVDQGLFTGTNFSPMTLLYQPPLRIIFLNALSVIYAEASLSPSSEDCSDNI